jgi:ABC-type methionine transport system ATPase subunit
MGRQLLRFTFTPENVAEPIVYEVGREFGLATNIRRANVARDGGWVVLELEGDDEEIGRAVEWTRERGVTVEPVPDGDGATNAQLIT